MGFLEAVQRWVGQSQEQLGPSVEIRVRESPDGRRKRAIWVEIEGHGRGGQLTVWESGETEIEVYGDESMEPVIQRYEVAESPRRIEGLLDELLSTVSSD